MYVRRGWDLRRHRPWYLDESRLDELKYFDADVCTTDRQLPKNG